MNRLTKIRLSLLATISVAVLLVLGKSILFPNTKKQTFTPFVFPETVSLPEWQFVGSNSLDSQTPPKKNNIYISGNHYRYIQKDLPIDIEMRYEVKTSAEVKDFLKNYTAIPSSSGQFKPLMRQQKGVGFYNLFVHQDRTYLLACINPRGGSTTKLEQFMTNRNTYDMGFDRFVPWLLGQSDFRDRRCLWALLSRPLNKSSPEDAYKTLEKAWFAWYQWWMPNFPKS